MNHDWCDFDDDESSHNSPTAANLHPQLHKIEEDLKLIDSGEMKVKNRTRKRRRLLAKKEKMKVLVELSIREHSSNLSTNQRNSLYYYSRKYSKERENDADFLERKLMTELGLTWEDWEQYFLYKCQLGSFICQ